MEKQEVIREWIEATEAAMEELHMWLLGLQVWQHKGGECEPGEFDRRLSALQRAGLEGWVDGNKAGGGLDALADVIRGESPSQSRE